MGKWIQLSTIGADPDPIAYPILGEDIDSAYMVDRKGDVFKGPVFPSTVPWDKLIDGEGKRIACDGVNVFIIDSAAQISWASLGSYSSPRWEKMPGTAKDISLGRDGALWIIGAGGAETDGCVYYWSGAEWLLFNTEITDAVRIVVDAMGWPWVTNTSGHIYRWVGHELVGNRWVDQTWLQMTAPHGAVDLAVVAQFPNRHGAVLAAISMSEQVFPVQNHVWYWDTGGQFLPFGSLTDAIDANGAISIGFSYSGFPKLLDLDGNVFEYEPDGYGGGIWSG